jgi:hypothetical protein
MADLSRSVVIDWRQIAAERADPVTASNRDRITPQIHTLLDQPGVPRSCFIEGGGSTTGKLAAAANSNLRLPPVLGITRHGRFAGLETAQSPRAGEANFLLDEESNDHEATVRMVP